MSEVQLPLSEGERRFLRRQLRYGRACLWFMLAEICVALGLFGYMVLIQQFNGTRFALAIVLLLAARGNLKQFRGVNLLRKLTAPTAPEH